MVELIVVNSGGHAEEDGDTLHTDVEARKESEG
jgi:hypothetical protein